MAIFRLLVVDDEPLQRDTLAEILRDTGYIVNTAAGVDTAKTLLQSEVYDLILTDFKMPDGTGLDVASFASQQLPESVVLIMTAYADVNSVIQAMHLGVADYLLKPLDVPALLKRIAIIKDRHYLRSQVEYLRRELHNVQPSDNLIGISPAIQSLRQTIRQVADTRGTVLITGDSGTGKEVVARLIHMSGGGDAKKFIAINCGAIPEQIIESELFGHKKGAFTGASTDKTGLFLAANGGSIFLDEIGELPRNLQVKILRVIQEREVIPVGDTKPKKIDIRIIAATNRDLKRDVEQGNFRGDLYYRLNVVQLYLPPLCERREDIPDLVEFMLKKWSKELRRPLLGISNDAMQKLKAYHWPGNIRELENVIERSIILHQGNGVIHVNNLSDEMDSAPTSADSVVDLEKAVHNFSREHILKTLSVCSGDKKEAAKLLGVGLSSLYRKLEELEIKNDR